ncbi:RELT-like protein 2 isoform 3-T3 [Theristicus caerulescens]
MQHFCKDDGNFWAEHYSGDPRRSLPAGLLEPGNLACLAATWTTSGAGTDDPPSGHVHIVRGVTSVIRAAEEVQEESGREIRMSDQNSTDDGESDPQHSLSMVFLLVLVFFIMGLVGFLICHVLKKKGYRCRTFRDELDPDNKDVLAELQANEEEELNEDTVEKIVRCIIQNEANAEALKEMLGDNEGDIPVPVPSLCPHRNSQDGGPPHHHTVHLGSTQAPCIHCSKRKRHPLHRQGRSKDGKGRMHPGETTVFSVGRCPSSRAAGSPEDPGASCTWKCLWYVAGHDAPVASSLLLREGFVSHTSGRNPLSTSSRMVPCLTAAGSQARRSWSTAATGSSGSGLAMGLSPRVACRTELSRKVPKAARVGSRAAPPPQPRTHQPAPALATAGGRARGPAWQARCRMLALLPGAPAARGSS